MINFFAIPLIILVLTISGCNEIDKNGKNPFTPLETPNKILSADFKPVNESEISGHITFHPETKGLKVVAVVKNSKPGKYVLYLHKFGSCRNGGSGAGPVYLPDDTNEKQGESSGYMGELLVDEDNNANLTYIDSVFSISGKNGILGRSVLIKETGGGSFNPENPKILGCGVIGLIAE